MLSLECDGSRLHARVLSEGRDRAYTIEGTFERGLYCSCHWGRDCKHVAAALLAHLRHAKGLSRPAPAAEPALSAEATSWLAQLRGPRRLGVGERLAFRLELVDLVPKLSLATQMRGGSGQWSSPRPLSAEKVQQVVEAQLGEQSLVEAVQSVSWDQQGVSILRGKAGAMALDALLDTKRLVFVAEGLRRELCRGPALSGKLAWRAQAMAHVPCVQLEEEGSLLLPLTPMYYVDPRTGNTGVVEIGADATIAQKWLSAPPVARAEARSFARDLAEVAPEAPSPLSDMVEEVRTAPQPVVRLCEAPAAFWRGVDIERYAELRFRYGTVDVPAGDGADPFIVEDGDRTVHVVRDVAAEEAARIALIDLAFWPVPRDYPITKERWSLRSTDEWLRFLMDRHLALRERGFEIEVDESFSLTVVEDAAWYSDLEPSDNDWFEVQLGIRVEDQRLDLLPLLVDAIGKDAVPEEGFFLELQAGRYVHVPHARVAPLAELLIELLAQKKKGEQPRVPRLRAMDLAVLLQEQGKTFAALRKLREELASPQETTWTPPQMFRGTLRDYQVQGVGWLERLGRAGLGGVLADDMGLGKTVQLIALLCRRKEQGAGPSLIVAPTSVLLSWSEQLERFAPELDVLVWSGPDRHQHASRLGEASVVLASYTLLRLDSDKLKAIQWDLAVLDEAQVIKNAKSQYAEKARELRAQQRIALTGTPMENHLGELWSIVSFANSGALGSEHTFRAAYRSPIEKGKDGDRLASLRRRVAPILLRRTKEEVATELPDKTLIDHPVELTDAQRDVYETVRAMVTKRVRDEIAKKGIARSQIMVLDALLKLRQVCCDPRLLSSSVAKSAASAKLQAFEELVRPLVDEGRKVLVFSQFVTMLDILSHSLKKLGIEHSMLTGSTVDRAGALAHFQKGSASVFLISLKAGGTGLNLVEADTVIHYDPWWNPAVENQATDRAHRIGQTKPVFVHRLIARGTVEEKIVALQVKKAELARGLLEGSDNVVLDANAIDELLAPLPSNAS